MRTTLIIRLSIAYHDKHRGEIFHGKNCSDYSEMIGKLVFEQVRVTNLDKLSMFRNCIFAFTKNLVSDSLWDKTKW